MVAGSALTLRNLNPRAAPADSQNLWEFARVNLGLSHPEAEMSSGARVWRAARTALLLLGATTASAFMVQLPAPLTGGQAGAATHVPASDKWLALGEPAMPDPRGWKAVSAVNPIAALDGREPRTRRRQRGIRLASLGGPAPQVVRSGRHRASRAKAELPAVTRQAGRR